jgi:hypothetical protein
MKIRIEHQNLGAALLQIAEHPQFTAINSLQIKTTKINNAFLINTNTALFLKYASGPNNNSSEYIFTFSAEQMGNIKNMHISYAKLFFGLVCVEDREICCLTYDQFATMIQERKSLAKQDEESYQILVTVKQGGSLRAYMNAPGKKGQTAGEALVITRKSFPEALFG